MYCFARENGKRANLYMGLSLGVITTVGVASLITGVVLFKKGKRLDNGGADDAISRIQVLPALGGAVLRGRF